MIGSSAYFVYFDSECQCELARFYGPRHNENTGDFTPEYKEWIDSHDLLGGGNYNYYHCLKGLKIVKVQPRSKETGNKLVFTLEEE